MNVRSNPVHQQSFASLVLTVSLVLTIVAIVFSTGLAHAPGNVARGQTLYKGCADCHSINENAVGPMHKGVVGRKAGSVPGYDYSADLKNSGIVWTEDNLDKWLQGPKGFIAGVRMPVSVPDSRDRRDVIAFLESLQPGRTTTEAAVP